MHIMALVLIPLETGDIPGEVAELLEPHAQPPDGLHENCECRCVGGAAWQHATEAANREVGTIEEIRERYRTERLSVPREERHQFPSFEDYLRPWHQVYDAAAKAHPDWGVVDPACSQCGGSGRTTRDVAWIGGGEYDWYVIGGRFTGALDPKYDPRADPRNFGTCPFCKGTGAVPDNRPGQCRWCEGRGEAVLPYWEPFEGDIRPVGELLDPPLWTPGAPRAQFADFILSSGQLVPIHLPADRVPVPEAVVAPDGEWHGRDSWDDSQDETDAWARDVQDLLAQHPDTLVVVVDCHTY